MLQFNQNRLDMLKVVGSVCDKQTALFSTVPALHDAYARYKAILSEIDAVGVQAATVVKGVTAGKNQVREQLVKSALVVSRALMAYAHLAGNVTLQQEVHYSQSAFRSMSNKNLLFISKKIYDKGVEFASDIANYGVDNTMLAQFLAAYNDFSVKAPAPREAIDVRKANNEKIGALVSQAADLLSNEIDNLVFILPDENADFKNVYKNSRNIVSRHGKTKNAGPPPNENQPAQ